MDANITAIVVVAIFAVIIIAVLIAFRGRLRRFRTRMKIPGGAELEVEASGEPSQPERVATGERAVSAGGDMQDTIVLTGDRNIVLKGADAASIGKALAVLSPQRRRQLPPDLADFTGREEEVEELVTLLSGGGAHAAISAIGGMGGVGKSALAVHVAHRVADHYPDGRIVVDMRGTSDQPIAPGEAMGEVIYAFQPEARLPDGPDQVARLYHSVLEGQRALVVLDNAADAAQVRPLVPSPPCALVVTSRRAIVLPGVRRFDLDALSDSEARDLLRGIVGGNRATDGELDEVARVCARLPLALRAAGTFLAVHIDWPAGEYVQALADERQRLQRLRHEDLDVEAALGLSAAQLARQQPELAARWQMLSVFPGTFDRQAAAAVWDVTEEEARDGLTTLVAGGLLLYDQETGRYRLHDLMRLVARNAFGYGGDEPDAELERRRLREAAASHAAHYKDVAATADDLYLQGGDGIAVGLSLLDLEMHNVLAGQTWAAAHAEEEDDAAALCSAYPSAGAYLLDLRKHPRARIGWLESALAAARRLRDCGAEAAHLGNLGNAYADLGEPRRAIEYYEQQLAIAGEIGDRRGEGNALNNLGLAYAALGETRRAIDYYEQQLAITREIGDRRGEGNALGNLGVAHRRLGEPRRANEYYEQALAIEREIGDRRSEGQSLGNLGNAYAALGEPRRAIEHYDQALDISREIGDRRGEGNALFNMALALDSLGDRARAISNAEAALQIYEQIEDPNAARVRQQLSEWRGQHSDS